MINRALSDIKAGGCYSGSARRFIESNMCEEMCDELGIAYVRVRNKARELRRLRCCTNADTAGR